MELLVKNCKDCIYNTMAKDETYHCKLQDDYRDLPTDESGYNVADEIPDWCKLRKEDALIKLDIRKNTVIDVKLRYNTMVDDNFLYWRVIIDGIEYLASNVRIEVPTFTTKNEIDGVGTKHHISCEANEVIWDEKTKEVTIK